MRNYEEGASIIEILQDIKRRENYEMSLMSRDELIQYIVYQMEFVEENFPEMLVTDNDEDNLIR